MKIVIDISEELCRNVRNIQLSSMFSDDLHKAIYNGTPLIVSEDGTLTVTVDDATKIGRVLVQDKKHNGGLFYADRD